MLARLVDCDGMCCVVFALGAIGVNLFGILRFLFTVGKAGLGLGRPFIHYPCGLVLSRPQSLVVVGSQHSRTEERRYLLSGMVRESSDPRL